LLLNGDLDGIDYKIVKLECEEKNSYFRITLLDVESPKVNIENQLKTARDVLLRLDLLYKNGKVALKREIIGLIFPAKLSFDGKQHRTSRLNEVVSIICMISSELEGQKGQTSSKRVYQLGWTQMGAFRTISFLIYV